MINLKDKVAIITGSRRGIGYKIAEKLAAAGATIVISDLDQAGCEEAAKGLADKYNVPTLGQRANVTVFEEVETLIKTVQEKFGKIDILVNNAGITRDNLILRMSIEEWQAVINTNLTSVFVCTKAVMRTMLKQKSGTIVNIASVVGVMGNAGQANYAAAKGGVISFTKTVAKELGAKGITCNAVAPGFIQTDMTASLPKEYLDNIINLLPQKRLGTAEEVASVVLFLASPLASYVTGQVINIDGGMVM
jgi:3-oxoacyl-[acyl-carrier protein] reductase